MKINPTPPSIMLHENIPDRGRLATSKLISKFNAFERNEKELTVYRATESLVDSFAEAIDPSQINQ